MHRYSRKVKTEKIPNFSFEINTHTSLIQIFFRKLRFPNVQRNLISSRAKSLGTHYAKNQQDLGLPLTEAEGTQLSYGGHALDTKIYIHNIHNVYTRLPGHDYCLDLASKGWPN